MQGAGSVRKSSGAIASILEGSPSRFIRFGLIFALGLVRLLKLSLRDFQLSIGYDGEDLLPGQTDCVMPAFADIFDEATCCWIGLLCWC